MSLLMQERRMATARATTMVEAIAIPADDLAKMEAEMPEVVAALRDVMAARRERNDLAEGRRGLRARARRDVGPAPLDRVLASRDARGVAAIARQRVEARRR